MCGSLIMKITQSKDIRQNTGKAKKGVNQVIRANKVPITGLSTLPVPFAASVTPSTFDSVAPL
ncbi:hypothetical protein J23TS9_13430 [Paenibacillus sp. J23TS9]|nr:hypothetical protein J23TS9_13430 [Paenibacillus sp. J23TS9]